MNEMVRPQQLGGRNEAIEHQFVDDETDVSGVRENRSEIGSLIVAQRKVILYEIPQRNVATGNRVGTGRSPCIGCVHLKSD